MTTPGHSAGAQIKSLVILLCALLVIAFGVLSVLVQVQGTLVWEVPLMWRLHGYATPWLDAVMTRITNLGEFAFVAPIALVVAVVLVWRRRYQQLTFFMLGLVIANTADNVLKLAFHRLRPMLWTDTTGYYYSFPSGHSTASFTLAVLCIALAWNTRWRWPMLMGGSVYAIAVGFSRVYLGVHYPTDVVGAWLASSAIIAGITLVMYVQAYRWHSKAELRLPPEIHQ